MDKPVEYISQSVFDKLNFIRPTFGIVVDGYCKGNPGVGGYRGVDLHDGKILFKRNFQYTTNNLVEFIGIVHAQMYIKKTFESYSEIYSDSQCAISWFRTNNVKSEIDSIKGKDVLNDLNRCLLWLSEQKKFPASVLKWETKEWGENPADFGNK